MDIRLPKKDQERIKKQVRKEEAKKLEEFRANKKCIVCGKEATHCMRGLPTNTYCKECAKEHFKFLSYLERL